MTASASLFTVSKIVLRVLRARAPAPKPAASCLRSRLPVASDKNSLRGQCEKEGRCGVTVRTRPRGDVAGSGLARRHSGARLAGAWACIGFSGGFGTFWLCSHPLLDGPGSPTCVRSCAAVQRDFVCQTVSNILLSLYASMLHDTLLLFIE